MLTEEEFNHALGQNIAAARRRSGLNQTQLAEAVGLSRVSISNIERGQYGTSTISLSRIMATLDAAASELVPTVGAPLPPLVKVEVSTRYPEKYLLHDLAEDSRWVIRDGGWSRWTE